MRDSEAMRFLQLLSQRGDGAVETQRGACGEFDFAEGVVGVKDVDRAELIEVEAHVRGERGLEDFRAEINVFRADEGADAGALMALLDLVPPAIDLVADHGGLFDEEAQRGSSVSRDFCAPATEAKNSQPGKTLTPPAAAISAAISSVCRHFRRARG